ncbi:MAG: MarR family winged helix-turn-helix transcriptional regulator [Gallionellaceae bacterium]|jgi:MarR family 2-MHQ and catechol resistance regulon transcriptional repressor
MSQKPFLPVMYELVRTYQAFESYSASNIRALGLTAPQFDIIATLGNTQGMSFKELGEKTLITKGTLTGVVDRLTARNLVRRVACPHDARSQYVQLTKAGQKMFESVFPAHLKHMERVFSSYSQQELDKIETVLQRLKNTFLATDIQSEETA